MFIHFIFIFPQTQSKVFHVRAVHEMAVEGIEDEMEGWTQSYQEANADKERDVNLSAAKHNKNVQIMERLDRRLDRKQVRTNNCSIG